MLKERLQQDSVKGQKRLHCFSHSVVGVESSLPTVPRWLSTNEELSRFWGNIDNEPHALKTSNNAENYHKRQQGRLAALLIIIIELLSATSMFNAQNGP